MIYSLCLQISLFFTSDWPRFFSAGGNYHVVIWQFDLANKKLRPTQARPPAVVGCSANGWDEWLDVTHDEWL